MRTWCLLLNQNAGMWRGLDHYFVPFRYLCADVWSWAVKQDLTVEVTLQSLYRDLDLSNSNLLSCFMMSHCDCWVYRTRMMLLFELKGIWGHGLSFSPSHWWIIFWDYCSCRQQVKQICIDCLKILKYLKRLKVWIMIVLWKKNLLLSVQSNGYYFKTDIPSFSPCPAVPQHHRGVYRK